MVTGYRIKGTHHIVKIIIAPDCRFIKCCKIKLDTQKQQEKEQINVLKAYDLYPFPVMRSLFRKTFFRKNPDGDDTKDTQHKGIYNG